MFHILNPLYLIGLSLGAIPLILHLLGRRRVREKPFSTLLLLREIKKSRSVWMRIRDLMLLVLRTLFILLAVLAFSHPLMLSPVPFLGKSAPRDVVLLFDVSMSMGAQGVLERAKQQADALIDRLSDEARWTLISFSDRIEEEHENLTPSEASDAIRELQPTYRATDLLPALKRAAKHLATKDGFIKEIIVVSDFAGSGTANIAPVVPEISRGGVVTYGALITSSTPNTYFSDWSMEPPFALPGMKVTLSPHLVSPLPDPEPVDIFLKGIMRGTKKMTRAQSPSFEFEVKSPGYQWGWFRTGGDSMHMDNNHYFTYLVPEHLNVLLVGNGHEQAFIAAAFSPGIETVIRLNMVSPSELVKTNPLQYDLLILYNVLLKGAARARVMDYLSNGGGVLYIMGNTTGTHTGTILNTVAVVKKNEAETGFFAIKTVDTGFPPFSDLENKGLENLKDTKVYRYYTISSPLTPIVTARNGDPLLAYGTVQNGKVALFTFALDPDWSQFPLKAVFVPVLYRLAFFLAEKQEKPLRFKVGDAIRIDGTEKQENPLFLLPDGEVKTATETEDGYMLRHTELPGIYTFVSPSGESLPVAVNVDVAESDLEQPSFEELEAAFSGIQPVERAISRRGKRWLDLFPFLLVLSLLCLAAELILQNG